jgi:hypothetical protein
MKTLGWFLTRAGCGVLAATLLMAPAPARAADDGDLTKMIETAKTAADHEAIAAEYDRRAATARKEAERHRRMEKAYGTAPVAGKGTPTPLPQHCAALARHYENAAQEYETLAAAHREMAKAPK